MIDLIVRGGQVVTLWGVGSWDVAVQGEKIVAVAESGSLTEDVGRVIDASGKIVVPGGIEPHAHIAAPLVGQPGVETAPPEQVSRAALFGGTTTLTDFAIQRPDTDLIQAIDERTSRWRQQSYCDYSHHLMLQGKVPSSVVAQMKESVEAGFPTFKIFTTNVRPLDIIPPQNRRRVGMGYLNSMMQQAADSGGLMLIHSEDDDIVQYMYHKLAEEERTEWYNIHEVHNNLSEDLSFRGVLRLAEWAEAAVYFVHVSAKEGVNAIREFRDKGLPVYGETLHNYVSFTSEDYKKARRHEVPHLPVPEVGEGP